MAYRMEWVGWTNDGDYVYKDVSGDAKIVHVFTEAERKILRRQLGDALFDEVYEGPHD